MADTHILIVEDDEAIATGLALNLKLAGHVPVVVADGDAALASAQESPPDLILLDLNLPKLDGLEVLRELRRRGRETPVVVLSAREGEYDKVAALRLGADDYVTKPFGLAELLARVEAVLRRSGKRLHANGDAITEFGDVRVDLPTRAALRNGAPTKLTHLEFELLSFFLHHPSRVFSREELLRQVWRTSSGSLRTVDNFVAQLRSKLEADPEAPVHLITVRGTGYRFDP